jgi:hypothetical protein
MTMKLTEVTAHHEDRKVQELIERIEEQTVRRNVAAAFAAYIAPNVLNTRAFIAIDASSLMDQKEMDRHH